MPEHIVDRLEPIEIEECEREPVLVLFLFDLRFERRDESATIGKAGQKIGSRCMNCFLMSVLGEHLLIRNQFA